MFTPQYPPGRERIVELVLSSVTQRTRQRKFFLEIGDTIKIQVDESACNKIRSFLSSYGKLKLVDEAGFKFVDNINTTG